MDLNPEKDVTINVSRLTDEFQMLPLLMYRYSQIRAESGYVADLEEALLKEVRAEVYKSCIQGYDKKPSDKVLEAEVEVHPKVVAQRRKALEAKRDHETVKGYVESIKAKKDMLIQLGSDRRKES